jgi:soluble lytic murein transglycosylase-like protein
MNAIDTRSRAPGLEVVSKAYAATKALLALLGLIMVLALAMPASREALLNSAGNALRATEPPGVANFATGSIQSEGALGAEREQRAVAEMLAKRYRIAQEAVTGFVSAAYRAGKETAVDPLLILAVISVESRFNPIAESTFGAKGLMQVIPKFHKDKLAEHGSDEALLDPEVNIKVGSQVLREYLRRFGDTETALQAYAGAYDEPTAQYANKVLSERSRIEQLLAKLRRAG